MCCKQLYILLENIFLLLLLLSFLSDLYFSHSEVKHVANIKSVAAEEQYRVW